MKTLLPKYWLIPLSLVLLSSGPLAQAQSPDPGSALNLDGTSGYAQVSNGVWFSGNFTVEGWVYTRSYNNWSRLFDFGNAGYLQEVYLALSEGTGGYPKMGVFTNGNNNLVGSSQQLPLNQWTHLAVTLSGSTATILMNGNPVGSGTVLVPQSVVRTNNYIGRSLFGGDAYADATFDEVRIWNVARTPNQIQAFMHRSLTGAESGLVGYWRMDEFTGTVLNDASGHGQTATLFGGTTWTNSTAPIVAGAGSALNFNAALGQAVTMPNFAINPNPHPLTIMTWFKSPTTNLNGALVNKYVSSSYNGFQLFMVGGHLKGWYFRDAANNVYNGGPMDAGPVNDGLWHHAAMVIDYTEGRLYLDGVLKSSLPWTGTPGPASTTQPISLGLYPGDSFWSGQLEDVSIWNASLSLSEIQFYMNRPPVGIEGALSGYWSLDEGSGTTAFDSSGYGVNGTISGNPFWVASPVADVTPDPGYALHFDGSNAYVDVPGFGSVAPTNEVTIEFWQRAEALKNQSTLSCLPDAVNNRINVHVPWSDGNVYWDFGDITTSGRLSYTPSSSIIGSWQHFAFVASQAGNYMAIYQNGVQVARKSGMTPFTRAGQDLILGAIDVPGGLYFKGNLDEVRIWNVARTPAQIRQTMNVSLTGGEANLVGYWRFDEGNGLNSVDATGRGQNAALAGSASKPVWMLSGAPVTNATLPQVNTVSATGITGSSATLNGAVFPNGPLLTRVWFEYGTTTSYGTTTTPVPFSSPNPVFIPFTGIASGLDGGTTYHFRSVASNALFTVTGPDLTFATPKYVLGTTNLVEGPWAGDDSVLVAQVPATDSWTATTTDTWLHVSFASQNGMGNSTVAFSYDANSGATRTGTLRIAGQLLTVTQAGASYVAAQAVTTIATSASGLNNPRALALDGPGNVYIADSFQETIDKWLPGNGTTFVLVSLQSVLGSPYGVAVDPAGSSVFFCDNYNNRFQRWTAANGIVTLASGLSRPAGVALDRSGNAYVAEVNTFRILKWTAASNSIAPLITGLNGLFGIAVDVIGNVYATDESNNRLQKWDVATSNLTTLADYNSGLNFPRGVAVDGSGNLYVANWGTSTVQKWSAANGSMTTLVSSGLNRPFGVAVDFAGTVYLADTGNNAIKALPYAFINPSPLYEHPAAGSDSLAVVLPATINLHAQFTPTSDQPWLTIVGSSNGVVTFSFTANTNSVRTAHITVLGVSIPVTQAGLIGVPPNLISAMILTNGAFRFQFTNTDGATFTVLTATNPVLPLSNWTALGPPSNVAPGLFQFTAPPTPNDPQRYYRVRSP